jgi:UDP-N-acetylmuramyl pentapeptide phosphotransferase/UDP-N-acetylglucosamine-1-phosphate transferase
MFYLENIYISFFLIIIFGIILNYILIKRFKILRLSNLLDSDYNKPQSFHSVSIPRIGGLVFYIIFVCVIFFFTKRFYYDLFF